MMREPSMKLVTAPGLPPYPKLWFDKKRQRALVAARHATWYEYEWAARTTVMLSLMVTAVLVYFVWNYVPESQRPGGIMLLAFVATFVHSSVNSLLYATLRPLIARRIYASKTTIWFTPRVIAFRSRLYARPVLIWRKWRTLPVDVRFIIEPDRNALQYDDDMRFQHKPPIKQLQEAMVLKVVLRTLDRFQGPDVPNQNATLRAIPLTEMGQVEAVGFAMVYAAAAALTASADKGVVQSVRAVDIDQ
jgi:hypothetical protein